MRKRRLMLTAIVLILSFTVPMTGMAAMPEGMHFYDPFESYSEENPITDNTTSWNISKITSIGCVPSPGGGQHVELFGPSQDRDFYLTNRFVAGTPGFTTMNNGIQYALVDEETGERTFINEVAKIYYTCKIGGLDNDSKKCLYFMFYDGPLGLNTSSAQLVGVMLERGNNQIKSESFNSTYRGVYETGKLHKFDFIFDFQTGYMELYVDGKYACSGTRSEIAETQTYLRTLRFHSTGQNADTTSGMMVDDVGYKIYDADTTIDEIRLEFLPGFNVLEINTETEESELTVKSRISGEGDATVLIAAYSGDNKLKEVSFKPFTASGEYTATFGAEDVSTVKTFVWDMSEGMLSPLADALSKSIQ